MTSKGADRLSGVALGESEPAPPRSTSAPLPPVMISSTPRRWRGVAIVNRAGNTTVFTGCIAVRACRYKTPKHRFLLTRSIEGVAGGIRRWSGVRRPRPVPCKHGTRAVTGIRPGALRPQAIRRYRTTAGDTAEMQELGRCGRADPKPKSAVRSAEGRSVLRQGTRHARQGVQFVGRHSALRPLGFARGPRPALPGRKHDGQPRGRPMPRTISHGCMTSESDEASALSGVVTHGARLSPPSCPRLVAGIH